jgi:hypothetical protein
MAGSLKILAEELAKHITAVQVRWNFYGIKPMYDYTFCMARKIYNCHIRTLFVYYKVRHVTRK